MHIHEKQQQNMKEKWKIDYWWNTNLLHEDEKWKKGKVREAWKPNLTEELLDNDAYATNTLFNLMK